MPEPPTAARPPALAWPNRCAVCRGGTRGAAGRLCDDCLRRHAPPRPRCRRCALAVPAGVALCGACLRAPPPWCAAVALADYGYPWDGLLGALKFRAALDLVPALGDALAARVALHAWDPADLDPVHVPMPERSPGPGEPRMRQDAGRGRTGPSAVALLLPVPLADTRLRERGYNQAALLAQRVARRLRLACAPQALRRTRDTGHQLALPREQRAANVRGAFAVVPAAAASLRGRHVALVDDVMTTGATLAEAARVLLAAGAAEVQAWVVARTPD